MPWALSPRISFGVSTHCCLEGSQEDSIKRAKMATGRDLAAGGFGVSCTTGDSSRFASVSSRTGLWRSVALSWRLGTARDFREGDRRIPFWGCMIRVNEVNETVSIRGLLYVHCVPAESFKLCDAKKKSQNGIQTIHQVYIRRPFCGSVLMQCDLLALVSF